jgi:hypothetical protein
MLRPQPIAWLLTRIVSKTLSSLVEEEDVVDQLNGQCLTDAGSEGRYATCCHQAVKAIGLYSSDKTCNELG